MKLDRLIHYCPMAAFLQYMFVSNFRCNKKYVTIFLQVSSENWYKSFYLLNSKSSWASLPLDPTFCILQSYKKFLPRRWEEKQDFRHWERSFLEDFSRSFIHWKAKRNLVEIVQIDSNSLANKSVIKWNDFAQIFCSLSITNENKFFFKYFKARSDLHNLLRKTQ